LKKPRKDERTASVGIRSGKKHKGRPWSLGANTGRSHQGQGRKQGRGTPVSCKVPINATSKKGDRGIHKVECVTVKCRVDCDKIPYSVRRRQHTNFQSIKKRRGRSSEKQVEHVSPKKVPKKNKVQAPRPAGNDTGTSTGATQKKKTHTGKICTRSAGVWE